MHKDKGQALVEFLTAEYASAALSFDGSILFGSIIKIRRPKDYVEFAVRMRILYIPSFFYLYLINIRTIEYLIIFPLNYFDKYYIILFSLPTFNFLKT